jgi:hypothetical protein
LLNNKELPVKLMTRILFPLLFSIGLSVALTLGMTLVLPGGVAISKAAPWAEFFTVFGVIYAIISGFILLDVLNRHTDLASTVESELNAVEDLRDFLVYIDGEQDDAKFEIKQSLLEYLRSVCDREWKLMRAKGSINADTSPELYKVMSAINRIQVTNPSDQVALASLIEKLSDITSLRTRRIILSNERLPSQLIGLLLFMSSVLVVGFACMVSTHFGLHAAMVGAITTAVHLLFMIIRDLDQPFQGAWNIRKDSLTAIRDEFERDLA